MYRVMRSIEYVNFYNDTAANQAAEILCPVSDAEILSAIRYDLANSVVEVIDIHSDYRRVNQVSPGFQRASDQHDRDAADALYAWLSTHVSVDGRR